MKRTLLLAPLVLLQLAATAQKHVYEDLLVLFVDEKYEKCLAKAETYTLNDATKKDPLPFLYMSMSFFEMSQLEKFAVDYPKASRDALKFAEKYRKKDKEKEFFNNYEDYWAELNTRAMEDGENLMEDPKGLSKAKAIWDAMTGYYPENPGPWLMLAICQHKGNMVRESDVSVQSFEKALDGAGDISTLPPDQKRLLKNAVIRYADHMQSKGMRDQAKKYVAQIKDQYMDEPDFKGLYETLF